MMTIHQAETWERDEIESVENYLVEHHLEYVLTSLLFVLIDQVFIIS